MRVFTLEILQVHRAKHEEEGSVNNGKSFKYYCKHAKICASEFMISALISSTMGKISSIIPNPDLFKFQTQELVSDAIDGFSLFYRPDVFRIRSWISAASSHWNLFKLNFIIFTNGFPTEFPVITITIIRARERESEEISRNSMEKKYYYILKRNEKNSVQ